MGTITSVRAYANNEVAYIAWDIDGLIADCLGFEVTRVYIDAGGAPVVRADGTADRVKVATWVAFKGQHNPHWLPQDAGVWPIQKLSWRDLTLRKRRDAAERRPDEVRVRYEVRPVGDLRPGLEAVPSNGREFATITKRTANGAPVFLPDGTPERVRVKAYDGPPRPLGYLAAASISNNVHVTQVRGPFRSTFTNGILAAQWLRNVLLEDGVITPGELLAKIQDPKDRHRQYLAGDVLPLVHQLFGRPGEFFLGLYELEDEELLDILLANRSRIHVILSNTSQDGAGKWDARNAGARQQLIDAHIDIQHRMFNNSTHIGHNKFVVHVPPDGTPAAVLTGSTNWTSTGVAAQTNNALLIEDPDVAAVFMDYWKRMHADPLTVPTPFSLPMGDAQQGATFRADNATSRTIALGGATRLATWFSPNMKQRRKPAGDDPSRTPPDLGDVYRLMRQAQDVILFLAFLPGQSGKDCIIGEAIEIGRKDRQLIVQGAVSSAQAMPNYVAKKVKDGVVVEAGRSPTTFEDGNVAIVRAAAIDDQMLLGDFGAEVLTPRDGMGAIIHDKLLVIDPRSDNCHVVLGSHNLGFKASYSNDENLIVVSGDRALAEAYAVHILDVYDHYRFRAIEAQLKKAGKKGSSGFLVTDPSWQEGYVAKRKGAIMRYFAT